MSDGDDYEKGKALIEELWGKLGEPLPTQTDIHAITVEHLFGQIWSRPGLKTRDRSLITVAALTVLGRERQLRTHLMAALKAGLTRDELVEVMIHLAYYGGWPVAMTGLVIANEVFAEADRASAPSAP